MTFIRVLVVGGTAAFVYGAADNRIFGQTLLTDDSSVPLLMLCAALLGVSCALMLPARTRLPGAPAPREEGKDALH